MYIYVHNEMYIYDHNDMLKCGKWCFDFNTEALRQIFIPKIFQSVFSSVL